MQQQCCVYVGVCTGGTIADVPRIGVVLAGFSAGVGQWVVTYPADVVKTRIQVALVFFLSGLRRHLTNPAQANPMGTYRGFMHCLGTIVKEEVRTIA